MKKYLLLGLTACLFSMVSCTKDAGDSASVSDNQLATVATSTDYAVIRTTTNQQSEWKIKMNDIAARAYAAGTQFPNNAMLMKEKHDAQGNITGYDIMFRATGDKNSVGGWLYSSIDHHGKVIYDLNQRGASCQSCHSSDSKMSTFQ